MIGGDFLNKLISAEDKILEDLIKNEMLFPETKARLNEIIVKFYEVKDGN